MEQIYKSGKALAIGVSNFTIAHLKQLFENCTVKPSINQIEISPFFVRSELVDFCQVIALTSLSYAALRCARPTESPWKRILR